ncbi:MAG: TIGR03936 family radical SAM-associated protein [Dorea sp.]|nr:TIGR03936 family radical SAM-associated protein [Dorea sp.]
MKVRIKFRKYGVMKFIGHLDVMRYFQKAMRRANIPIAFTQGFSPHMIMSFAQPLGVGITSDGEYLDIELTDAIASKDAIRQLNEVMVDGMEVVSFVKISDDRKASGMTITAGADYKVYLLESAKTSEIRLPVTEELKAKVEAFMAQEEIKVIKTTKKSEKEVDIKPMIYDLRVEKDHIYMFLATGSEQNLKPDLVMESILQFAGYAEDTPVHYHRNDVYARNGAGVLVPLDHMGYELK